MVFFLGSIYPKYLFNALKNRGQFVDYPANVFQYSLLKGLDKHIMELFVITSPVIRSSYSSVKDICGRSAFSHNGNVLLQDTYVGTIPIPGIQIISEFCKVFKTLKNKLKGSKEKNEIIIYALHSPFLLSAVLLRKWIDCSCVVVPDLPEYMTSSGSLMRRIGKKIDRRVINFCLKRLDSYVLLSPFMREKLPIQEKPWSLIEGIYDTSNEIMNIERCKERVIFYGGSLSRQYGIIDLLEAFNGIDKDNYRLWICGDGDAKVDVIRMAERDNRVKYYGVLDHKEVLVLQQRATVLINPRSSAGEYTKYSFPSKTMEYLASGTPTIMCHLPAIPEEYDDYLYYITDESVEGIRQTLLEVCEKPQQILNEFGIKASTFIRNEKNAGAQAQKIIDLMNETQSVKEK